MDNVNHFNCKRKKDISMEPSVKKIPLNWTRRGRGSEGFVSDATKFKNFLFEYFPKIRYKISYIRYKRQILADISFTTVKMEIKFKDPLL